MNLTVNNTLPKNYGYTNNNSRFKHQQAFTAKTQVPEELINKTMKEPSKFFNYFNEKYDQLSDFIAEKFTSRIVESEALTKLADRFKNSDNFYQHCLTIGSVITSGLYVERTLKNDEMEKDRRNALAVDQGLTFVLSTIGAYALDKYLKGWWNDVTARFAGHLVQDSNFYENYLKQKQAVKEENIKILAAAKSKGVKPELKSMPKVTKLVEKHSYYKTLLKSSKDDAKILMTKVRGMSPLRAMIVFGFVYRYFVPVVVTKPANMLCEKYLEHKKAKENNIKK